MSKKELMLVLVLACINFTNIVDFMIMLPLGTTLMRIFEVSEQKFAFVVSAYAISAFLSGFTAAFYVDKFDRKKVLLFAYAGLILGTFGCGIAPNYYALLTARIVAGLFGGLIGAQILSILADSFPIEKRGTAMGILMSAFSVASVVGVPLGIELATRYNWHTPFTVLSILGFVFWIWSAFQIPNMVGHIAKKLNTNIFEAYLHILKDKNQLTAIFLSFTLMFGHFSVISFISPYMVHNVGFSETDLKYIYLFGGAVTIITGPLIGKMADKFGKFKVFAIFAVVAIIPVLILTHLGQTPIYITVIITSIFFIVSGGRIIPSQALVSTVVDPQHRGSFMSINSSVQQLGTGLASLVTGMIVYIDEAHHFHHFNYIGIGASVISLFCILIAKRLQIKN